jgi:nicotinic acid mononucleotide adenylyltransferase
MIVTGVTPGGVKKKEFEATINYIYSLHGTPAYDAVINMLEAAIEYGKEMAVDADEKNQTKELYAVKRLRLIQKQIRSAGAK